MVITQRPDRYYDKFVARVSFCVAVLSETGSKKTIVMPYTEAGIGWPSRHWVV
jgi:hypothetical protein